MGNNILVVVRNNLCCMCGGCSYICPNSSITMQLTGTGLLYPKVDEDRCISCGLCLQICPGINLREDLAQEIEEETIEGSAISTWVGKATDEEIYQNSQSGGTATAILDYLITSGEIDGAVVTCLNQANLRSKAIIARNKSDLMKSQKSKYCPVNLLRILKEVEEKNLSVVVVGLPCQVEGLYNILQVKKSLQKNIKYVIGLICDRTLAYSAIDFLLATEGFETSQIKSFEFRSKEDKGYPGDVKIVSKTGKTTFIPSKKRIEIKDYFTPPRCRLCFDKMNIFSDITLGDPWGIPDYDKLRGESLIIGRNQKGDDLINSLISNGLIEARKVDYGSACNGQHIRARKENLKKYLKIWMDMGLIIPGYYEGWAIKDSLICEKKYQKDIEKSTDLTTLGEKHILMKKVRRELFKKKLMETLKLPVKILMKFLKLTWR